jgi:hypothetical protein
VTKTAGETAWDSESGNILDCRSREVFHSWFSCRTLSHRHTDTTPKAMTLPAPRRVVPKQVISTAVEGDAIKCARESGPARLLRALFLLDLATVPAYTASTMERTELTAELEAALAEQKRCMGGVDAPGCVIAARRVSELRALLRNDPAFIRHLARVMAAAPRVRGPRR